MATTSKSHKSRKTAAPAPKPRKAAGSGPSSIAHAAANPDPTSDIAKPTKGALEQSAKDLGLGQTPGLEPPKELEEKKQYWYRPPDSKARKLFERIVIMRTAGHNDSEIAKKLKTTEAAVRQYVYLAKKNKWADDEGEPIDLEAELAINIDRKIVRNISASLDGQMTNWQTHEMTIAAAKGRGVFKSEKTDAGGPANAMAVVQIQIINPTVGAADQIVNEENVGGVPAYIEGDVSDEQRLLPDTSASSAVPMVPAQGVPDGAER